MAKTCKSKKKSFCMLLKPDVLVKRYHRDRIFPEIHFGFARFKKKSYLKSSKFVQLRLYILFFSFLAVLVALNHTFETFEVKILKSHFLGKC